MAKQRSWLGVDPGGKGCFGVAILTGKRVQTRCVSCAHEAVEWVNAISDGGTLSGLGVDAPLWWSAGPSGDRKVDQWLRRTFGLSGGAVQASNSLRGAALVQGALAVELLRRRQPNLRVTETHPKALVQVKGLAFCEGLGLDLASGASDHERDAIISAIAAREGFEGRWNCDLSEHRLATEEDPKSYRLAPVHYYWPE